MPTGRVSLASSAVDGKIYAIGGMTVYRGTYLSTVEEYDPATDTWTQRADMPTPRAGLDTSVVNGRIYAIGGGYQRGGYVETVWEYDPATDTWITKADMPTARNLVPTSVVNGKIYAFGGHRPNASPTYSIVEAYDPVADTWTKKADIPAPRAWGSTSVVDEKIYAFGGYASKGGVPLSTLFQYEPATDTWTAKDDMPVRLGGLSTSVVGRRIYVIGGTSALYPYDPHFLSTVWEFIPSPEFDFNKDGVVNAQDMSIMVDHWHTDTSRYDLAPSPDGDGIVDVQDLVALSEHLFEDYRIIANWMLDETEGDMAYDSAATHDAVVIGGAFWQPEGGQVGGALQLDGIDDYVNTPFSLDPADTTFSVFAWVKGGSPEQVILSQADGADWLMLDAQGYLKTTLKSTRRDFDLTSEVVINDDTWHRVGFTWDGTDRVLYVDDSEVARGTQLGLQRSQGDLYIGANNNLDPGSFWSGTIDDVRIYDRAITP